MHEMLARVMAGVDPEAGGAFGRIFANAWALVPWTTLFWWNLLFGAIGALLGFLRGGWRRGLLCGLILGPIGWLALLRRPRKLPPPLPRPRGGKPPARRGV